MKNYIDQLKETWTKSGLNADQMMESMIAQWKAMGVNPDMMLKQLAQATVTPQPSAPTFDADLIADLQDIANTPVDLSPVELQDPFSAWEDDGLRFSKKNGAPVKLLKAISCGALLTVINKSTLNTLATGLSKDEAEALLSRDWEINSRGDLVDTIDWLSSSGHRRTCEPVWQQLAKHPQSRWENRAEKILEALDFEADDLPAAEEHIDNIVETFPLVIKHIPVDSKASVSLFAWDACRAINLYRWGVDVGLVTEAGATQNILKIAELLYEEYDSWVELSTAYIIGTAMWSGNTEMVNDALHAHYLLTTNPQSPWQLIDWK
ncbi:MAG: DUF1266 domain-containing protein [Verrucomicrobia bacterium]|nr:DUF1266 domain-containing protein [Verrucomicrobiota bacterium]